MNSIRLLISLLIIHISQLSYCQENIEVPHVGDTLIQILQYEQFELNLKAMGSGYYWYMEPIDTTQIILIDSTVINKCPERLGGCIFQILTFQVIQKGDYQLVFNFKPAWLNDVKKKKIVRLKIE